jgi:hypothetical protein
LPPFTDRIKIRDHAAAAAPVSFAFGVVLRRSQILCFGKAADCLALSIETEPGATLSVCRDTQIGDDF